MCGELYIVLFFCVFGDGGSSRASAAPLFPMTPVCKLPVLRHIFFALLPFHFFSLFLSL